MWCVPTLITVSPHPRTIGWMSASPTPHTALTDAASPAFPAPGAASALPRELTDVFARCLSRAAQPVPQGLLRFSLGEWPLGWIHPMRVPVLQACWPELQLAPGRAVWEADGLDLAQRSARLAAVAASLRSQGAITGWRDEAFACEQPVPDPCTARGDTLFELERSAFRFFGLMSRAVHINGFLPGGRLLCGRRALDKATDPGRLDNLAAGGVPVGEPWQDCARRELWEEAGVPLSLSQGLTPRGQLRSTRMTPEGLHDEVLHVFSLVLPPGFVAVNRDGEVSEFLSLDLETLAQRLRQDEFSVDAAAVTAWGLLHAQGRADLQA
jgi:8-oxo-dGTP pyrophosphatase MutT (NUDIX family)